MEHRIISKMARGFALAAALSAVPTSVFAQGAQEKKAADDQERIARELIEVTQAYVVYKIGDFDAAFPAWMALARKGNRQGMLNVGNMYLAGEGVATNSEKAFAWYMKAAEAGSSIGLHQVAESYALGRGVAKDEAAARGWYERGAKAGSTESQLWLGETLIREGDETQGKARQGKARQGKARQGKARQGKARQGKARQGKVWLDKAAAQGDMRARDILGAVSPEYARTARPVHPMRRSG